MLNQEITQLAALGISLFVGDYLRLMVVPRYNWDFGGWYTEPDQKADIVSIAVLRLSDEEKDEQVVWMSDAVEIPF